jgi:hypothetical protein
MKFEKVNSATGAASPGFSRGTGKYSGNQHMKTNSDALINKGRGPTVGNKSDDDSSYPDARVTPKLPAQGSIRDNINRGPQVRESGGGRFAGTRAWAPSATQNYKGNADSINVGRGPTKGNQR